MSTSQAISILIILAAIILRCALAPAVQKRHFSSLVWFLEGGLYDSGSDSIWSNTHRSLLIGCPLRLLSALWAKHCGR